MAKENLRLLKPNVTRVDGYFYHIPDNADVLYKKTDDGTNAYSYALDTATQYSVNSLEYDGRWFWTLENTNTGTLLIRRWNIDNFILELDKTYTLSSGASNYIYDSTTFTVEHFHATFQTVASSGNTSISVSGSSFGRIEPGNRLFLGPSTFAGFEGRTEQAIVSSIGIGNQINLTAPLQNTYNLNNNISWAKRVWIFNKYRQNETVSSSGNGALLSFNIYDSLPTIVQRDTGSQYKSTTAAHYLKDPQDSRDYIVYMVETNLLFMETQDSNANFLKNVKSAAQNNQEINTTTIPVYEITSENNTIFRLQQKATFNTNGILATEDWSSEFNYQLSTLSRIPQSISLSADPAIISADAVSTSTIKAVVRDQFDQPVGTVSVQFSDDHTAGPTPGFVAPTSSNTTSGVTTTTYTSGDTAALVTITAKTKGA